MSSETIIHYAKLPYRIAPSDLPADQLTPDNFLASYNPFNDHRGLTYFGANEHQKQVVLSILPPDIRWAIDDIALCRIIGGAAPHKDHDCKCKINFYLRTGEARTVYFKDSEKPGISYHGDNRRHIYDIQKHRLRRTDEFTAQDGDIYLMDTSRIHAVFMEEEAERHMVSVSFRASFDEIYKNVSNYAAILPAELRPA